MTKQLMMLPQHVLDDAKKMTKKRGHAGVPGRGPDGETCKTCEHRWRVESASRKVFQKCGLIKKNWTHGAGTDIRAKDPACEFWEPERMTETVKNCGTCNYYAPFGNECPDNDFPHSGDCKFSDRNPLPFWVEIGGFVCDWQGDDCDTWEEKAKSP